MPKFKANQRPASVPRAGYICPLGAEDSFEQPLRGGGGRGSEGGLFILPVPPPLLTTGRNWHRGPQIQFCASNLILCLIKKGGPHSSTTTSQTLRHIPRGEEGIRRQFTEPSSRLPNSLFPRQALWPLLCQPQLLGLPRELQLLRPKPSAPRGDAGPSTQVAGSRLKTLNS